MMMMIMYTLQCILKRLSLWITRYSARHLVAVYRDCHLTWHTDLHTAQLAYWVLSGWKWREKWTGLSKVSRQFQSTQGRKRSTRTSTTVGGNPVTSGITIFETRNNRIHGSTQILWLNGRYLAWDTLAQLLNWWLSKRWGRVERERKHRTLLTSSVGRSVQAIIEQPSSFSVLLSLYSAATQVLFSAQSIHQQNIT